MKIAAIADLHTRVSDEDLIRELLDGIPNEAEVLVLAGDLTDNGLAKEAELLVKQLEKIGLPIVAVLGNHDHESNQSETICEILEQAGVHLLNANSYELEHIGFVGTKGFCGGFGSTLVQPFGEQALKTFIQTSIDEAVLLENALAKITCEKKVAVLHYAPVPETLAGEPLELYPFLGSSRLANAIDRQGVVVAFHGHAHHGSPQGITPGNVPVYNVSRFVLMQHTRQPYCLFEV